MIIKAGECLVKKEPKFFGGEGEVGCVMAKGMGGPCKEKSVFRLVGQLTVPPGASLGLHTHNGEEEIYVVLSGKGIYTDADGQEKEIGPGDVTFDFDGQTHGVRNEGTEPLVFIAVVAG